LPWTAEDLQALLTRLAGAKQEPTVLAMLDLATESDGRRVSWEDLVVRSGRTPAQVRSDLAHLTMIAKADFGRENWPATVTWRAGELSYLMDEATADAWRHVRHQKDSNS